MDRGKVDIGQTVYFKQYSASNVLTGVVRAIGYNDEWAAIEVLCPEEAPHNLHNCDGFVPSKNGWWANIGYGIIDVLSDDNENV